MLNELSEVIKWNVSGQSRSAGRRDALSGIVRSLLRRNGGTAPTCFLHGTKLILSN